MTTNSRPQACETARAGETAGLGARCRQLRFHVGMTRLVGRQAQIPGGMPNEVVINGSQREDICARRTFSVSTQAPRNDHDLPPVHRIRFAERCVTKVDDDGFLFHRCGTNMTLVRSSYCGKSLLGCHASGPRSSPVGASSFSRQMLPVPIPSPHVQQRLSRNELKDAKGHRAASNLSSTNQPRYTWLIFLTRDSSFVPHRHPTRWTGWRLG